MYDFKTFQFGNGGHKTRKDGMCVVECAAYLAGEEHSDHPECVDNTIARIAIHLNDSFSDEERNKYMRDLPWRLVGTANPNFVSKRLKMWIDFLDSITEQYRVQKNGSMSVYHSGERVLLDIDRKDYNLMALACLDEMIKLTEPQEIVPVKELELDRIAP